MFTMRKPYVYEWRRCGLKHGNASIERLVSLVDPQAKGFGCLVG